MRVTTAVLFTTVLICLQMSTEACEAEDRNNGCKIYGSSCVCGYGCKTEYIYRTRRACHNALSVRNSNICARYPCMRGICIQTAQDPGFICKCDGTGYYGQRCERECPSLIHALAPGMTYPHECIVI